MIYGAFDWLINKEIVYSIGIRVSIDYKFPTRYELNEYFVNINLADNISN